MLRVLAGVVIGMGFTATANSAELSPIEQLGKRLFFDQRLSNPPGQACASCHAPEVGFTGPNSDVNRTTGIYPGAAPGRFGNRKPPSAAYASFSPQRRYDEKEETYVGGQFWDGRAQDLVEQAKGPFLNPLEMNNAAAWDVVKQVQTADYRPLFEELFGKTSLQVDAKSADAAFDAIAKAIAAYEASFEVNAFTSKYDAYLAGRAAFTAAEIRGFALFVGKANCTACHPHQPGDDGSPPLFTDFTYDNVGAPRNPANPFFQQAASVNPDGVKYRDLGIGAIVNDAAHHGKVKVPTLRNVAKKPRPDFVKSYLHNGTFKSLKDVVHFYNVRNVKPNEFGPPDVADNVNRDELGQLGMTEAEERDLVAFLETLSDGYLPHHAPPRPTPSDPMTNSPIVPVTDRRFQDARDVLRIDLFRRRQTANGVDPTRR